MTFYGLIFTILGALIVAATGMAVTRRNQVHAVVYLVISFFGTAVLFYLLGAPLLAALEVIVFAGAIMVLFLFIIMTLNSDPNEELSAQTRRWVAPTILASTSAFALGTLIFSDCGNREQLRAAVVTPAAFGQFLFNHYWHAVEIVSFLLFVALVGALFLGRPEGQDPTQENKEIP